MGLRLTVPAEWEIVRHGTRPEQGSLSLVDRRQQRLQVRWRDLAGEPDLGQMIADHRARQLERDPDAEFYPFQPVAGWRGLSRKIERGQALTRALRYDAPTGRLIETVILTPPEGTDTGPSLGELLRSIEVTAGAWQATCWRAFDLEVQVPPGWLLHQVQVNPADASLRFKPAGKDGRKQRTPGGFEVVTDELTVRRMGMAASWYEGPEALLEKSLGRDVDFEMAADHHPPHNAVRAVSHEQGTRLRRWTGKLRRREDLIWSCPRENAVYQLTHMTLARRRGERRQRGTGTGDEATDRLLAGAADGAGKVAEGVAYAVAGDMDAVVGSSVAGLTGLRVGCCDRREEPGRWVSG